MQIRVTRVPPGNKPEWLWRSMVGLKLPLMADLDGLHVIEPHPQRKERLVIAVPSSAVVACLLAQEQNKAGEFVRSLSNGRFPVLFDLDSIEIVV